MTSLESLLGGGQTAQNESAAAPAEPPVREQRPAGAETEAAATGRQPAQGASDGVVRLQQQSTSPASAEPASSPAAPAPATTQQTAQPPAQPASQSAADGETPATGQGEAAAAGGEGQTPASGAEDGESGRRVVEGPKSGGVGGQLARRFDSLFSSSQGVKVQEAAVKDNEVTGAWLLDEEDGLRTCAVTLASRESGAALQAAPDCSGLATTATRWSIFGSDLLLSSSDNTVVARLRKSGEQWIGFTLSTGIPVVLSRPGATSG